VNAPPWADLVRVRLMYGRDRPRTLSALAEQLGTSRRIVEKAVEELALSGVPIVTGAEGAYLTQDPAELEQAALALRSRALTIMRRARALRLTARRHERVQQTTIWTETPRDFGEQIAGDSRLARDILRQAAS